ncbi:MAG: O-antigen polysaccharide polymerase Wzy family protein [Lachnospiraceae bacterium]|nr:O-antigen polysaccharide polymerase Wzy family protein [Lachnospiraceae bacterium]
MWSKEKKRILLCVAGACILIAALRVFCSADRLFAFVLMLWVSVVIVGMSDISANIVMLMFLMTFFTFLLGRETVYCFFHTCDYLIADDPAASKHTYISLLLSLAGLCVGYYLIPHEKILQKVKWKPECSDQMLYLLRRISMYLFYVTCPFMIIAIFCEIRYVHQVGYMESYAAVSGGVQVPFFIKLPPVMCIPAFFFFAATFPEKKEMYPAMGLYIFQGVLGLLTGQRHRFVMPVLISVIYCMIRSRETDRWISKRHLIFLAGLTPFLLSGLFLMDHLRLGTGFEGSFLETVSGFFASQGGSINVIKYGKLFEGGLKDVRFFSFSNIIYWVLRLEPYNGNSMECALHGYSFADRISYLIYGEAEYLRGRGAGSCYIAELYHDFGYTGIIVGSILYGSILYQISGLRKEHPLKGAFLLSITGGMLYAPRGAFDLFVANGFSRRNIAAFGGIVSLAFLIHKIKSRKESA